MAFVFVSVRWGRRVLKGNVGVFVQAKKSFYDLLAAQLPKERVLGERHGLWPIDFHLM